MSSFVVNCNYMEISSSNFNSKLSFHYVYLASSSNIKLKVELNGVPLSQCNRVYRSQNVVLSQKQLCAGGQPGKDSCRGISFIVILFIYIFDSDIQRKNCIISKIGDSGGPLMAVDTSDRIKPYHFLAGVVSFGPSPWFV